MGLRRLAFKVDPRALRVDSIRHYFDELGSFLAIEYYLKYVIWGLKRQGNTYVDCSVISVV